MAAGVLAAAGVVAAALLVGFVLNERRARDPLLPLDIFRLRTLRAADLASLTVLAAPFGFAYVTTLYMQDVQGHSALTTGLALLPGAVLSALVSRYAAPWLVERIGLRPVATAGMALVAVGALVGAALPVLGAAVALVGLRAVPR